MVKILKVFLGFVFLFGVYDVAAASTECEKAGGNAVRVKECDGSESEWCIISKEEQCYADQVKDGKCTVGEYSKELKGIVGITPRVLCDGSDRQ